MNELRSEQSMPTPTEATLYQNDADAIFSHDSNPVGAVSPSFEVKRSRKSSRFLKNKKPLLVNKPGRILLRTLVKGGRAKYTLGEFSIVIHQKHEGDVGKRGKEQSASHHAPSFYITHESIGVGKPLWSSTPGVNFVGAAAVSLTITNIKGSIDIEEQVHRIYNIQTIDAIERGPVNVITISGRLVDEVHGILEEGFPHQSPHYSLSLSLDCSDGNDGKALCFNLEVIGGEKGYAPNQAHILASSTADEAMFGFGLRFSHVNAKGHELQILSQDDGEGFTGKSAGNCTYCPSPQFVSDTGRSLFLRNTEPSVFDMRANDWFGVRVQSTQMKGTILAGNNPLDAIRLFTGIVGRMRPLPGWTQKGGAIFGMEGGSNKIRKVWAQLKRHDCPVGGILVRDWTGHSQTSKGRRLCRNYVLERSLYMNWDDLLDDLDREGVSVGVYITPFIEEIPPHLRAGRRYLYEEAADNGYFVKSSNGELYNASDGDCTVGLIDLTNENARLWFKDIIKQELLGETGANFWVAEFGEISPFDGVYSSGVSGLLHHNSFAEEWACLNQEAVKDAGRECDSFFITRSGFLNTPKYAGMISLGDHSITTKTNDFLSSALNGMLSGGFSGFSFVHCGIGSISKGLNIGSFRSGHVRSREMLCRWMEMCAFTPMFRTHEEDNSNNHIHFYSDEVTLGATARWAKVFTALADYRLRLFNEASLKGCPIVRHPIMHFPMDPNFNKCQESFMLGDLMYIAPIMKVGVDKAKVYLPTGEWVHLWTGRSVGAKGKKGGAFVDVPAPVGQPPVFYRKTDEMTSFVTELNKKGILFNKESNSKSNLKKGE